MKNSDTHAGYIRMLAPLVKRQVDLQVQQQTQALRKELTRATRERDTLDRRFKAVEIDLQTMRKRFVREGHRQQVCASVCQSRTQARSTARLQMVRTYIMVFVYM
jgi:hypothetical protein